MNFRASFNCHSDIHLIYNTKYRRSSGQPPWYKESRIFRVQYVYLTTKRVVLYRQKVVKSFIQVINALLQLDRFSGRIPLHELGLLA